MNPKQGHAKAGPEETLLLELASGASRQEAARRAGMSLPAAARLMGSPSFRRAIAELKRDLEKWNSCGITVGPRYTRVGEELLRLRQRRRSGEKVTPGDVDFALAALRLLGRIKRARGRRARVKALVALRGLTRNLPHPEPALVEGCEAGVVLQDFAWSLPRLNALAQHPGPGLS